MIDVLLFGLGLIGGAIITCIVITGDGYKLKLNRKSSKEVQE